MTKNNSKLENIANNSIDDPDIVMNAIERELNSVKFKAFGKVKVKSKKTKDDLDKLVEKKQEL